MDKPKFKLDQRVAILSVLLTCCETKPRDGNYTCTDVAYWTMYSCVYRSSEPCTEVYSQTFDACLRELELFQTICVPSHDLLRECRGYVTPSSYPLESVQ